MTVNSRRKGTVAEREIAAEYRLRGFHAARVPNSGGLDTKGDIVGVPGVHVECKAGQRIDLWKALRQAELETPPGHIPALHFRRQSRSRAPGANTGWYVAVPLDDFMDLLKAREAL